MSLLSRVPLVPATSTVVVALLLAGIGAALSAADLSQASEADKAAAAADYAPATGLDVRAALPPPGAVGGPGVIEPRDRPVELSVEVAGVVDTVAVVEGQQVAAGDVLLTLRDARLQAELAAAEADLAAARADLAAASGGSRDDDLAAARADAEAADARAALSADVARRTQALFDQGGATADERDRAAQTAAADAGAARAAHARRASIAAAAGEAVRLADARLTAATARRDQTARALDQLTLRAPIAGEVLQLRVRPGEHTAPSATGAVVLGDTAQLRARLDIDERDATLIKLDQQAEIRVEGLAAPQTGRVVEIGRRVGRKNVRTEDPTDRQDARFVEVVIALDAAPAVPIGVRVDGSVTVTP
jgi:multidrug resistance efflux pump